jgi:hypothetical protein
MKIADWRVASQYPAEDSPTSRWAWEFLRRNPEYQADFEATSIYPRGPGDHLSPHLQLEKLEAVARSDPAMGEQELHAWKHWSDLQDMHLSLVAALARKWSLSRGTLPDPTNHNAWKEDEFEIRGHVLNSAVGWDSRTGKATNTLLPRTPHPFFVFPAFDLCQPITKQLEAANRLMRAEQTHLIRGKLIPRPHHRARKVKKLVLYLRLLDARSAGVTNQDIRRALYPRIPDNPTATEKIKDDYRAALRLSAGGYATMIQPGK